ncbi:hypothetical protein ACHWQZ_G006783 [Mnemiopsis leidyi]
MKFLVFKIVLLCISVVCSNEERNDDIEKFVATSEWATLREGQSIGKGLHVRLNLQTGEKEAKLLSEEDRNTLDVKENQLTIKEDNVIDVGRVDDTLDLDQLEEGLKRVAKSDDNSETLTKKFRSIEELKKEMPNLGIKTEGQVLKDKIALLNSTSNSDVPSLIIVLEELEDLAHKYDNGQLLVTQGWMQRIGQLLEHSNEDVYRAALRVMSSAAQSNPPVQVHCIESGYLGTLISKLLSQPERLAKSSVFAISSMVRNLPAGLEVFSRLHGYNTLTTKLALSSLGSLQRAILTFYNDILEQESELNSGVVIGNLEPGAGMLCKKVAEILSDSGSSVDTIQEVLHFYSRILSFCNEDLNSSVTVRLRELLLLLGDEGFEETTSVIQKILQ